MAMNVEIIKPLLSNPDAELIYLRKTPSSNITAKEKAPFLPHGSVVIAEEQTEGRGRFERKFHSPPGTGIYMSVILKDVYDLRLITPAAAVAVCRAVISLAGKTPRIKWVNDILLDGGKICGILTEAAGNTAVVGIGINYTTDFSGYTDYTGITAAAIFSKRERPLCSREEIAARVINELVNLSAETRTGAFMDEYRALSCLNGEEISYTQNNEKHFGTVTGIDDTGRLLVKDGAGRITALSSGEVMLVRKTGRN